MIAVVSSTLAPSALPSHDGARTTFSPEERLEHTRGTVASLVAAGISDILIVDNSTGGWREAWTQPLEPARILHCNHPPFRNKGIGEMWLLLAALEHLPAGVPLMKISGRYRIGPKSPLLAPPGTDVVARVYQHGNRREISTRCYVLRDRSVAERLWPRTLDEIYAQQFRIVGPRSLLQFFRRVLSRSAGAQSHGDPPAAVELAAYDALKSLGLSLTAVDHLDVEGILGSWINPAVKE
jgi:hypothetical protein